MRSTDGSAHRKHAILGLADRHDRQPPSAGWVTKASGVLRACSICAAVSGNATMPLVAASQPSPE